MDYCLKVHHQNFQIIGICQLCKQDYISCKFCASELHVQHIDDFLLIDNMLLLLHQVINKIENVIQTLKSKKLLKNQQFFTFIQSKQNLLQDIRSQLINQTFKNNISTFQIFTKNIERNILNDILSYLITQYKIFDDINDVQNIKQIFIDQFQEVSKEYLILLMFDQCHLLNSIQKYKEALQMSQTLIKLTNKKYFLNLNIQEFNESNILKSNYYHQNLECLLGRNLYIIQEYKKSQAFYKKLCFKDQKQQILKECYIYLSLNLFQTEQYKEALDYLSMYSKIDPNNLLITYFEGYALERMNVSEIALEKYKQVALQTKELFYNLIYGKLFKQLGKNLLKSKSFQQAFEVFDKIITEMNQNKEIVQIYKLFMDMCQKELFQKYNKNLKKLIKYVISQIQLFLIIDGIIYFKVSYNSIMIGIILCQQNQFEEAYNYIIKIKDVEYIKDNLQSLQVIYLLKMNKISEAFQILSEMQKEDNYNALLQDTFLMIKENDKISIGALQYQKLIDINPKDSMALQFQGYCYYFDLKYDQAIECFDRAIALNAKLAYSYFYKEGQSLFRKIEFDQAIEYYQNAGKLSEEFKIQQIEFHKGNLYFFLFQFDKALEAHEKAYTIEISQVMKAIINWLRNKNEEAIQQAEKQKQNFQEISFMLSRLNKEQKNNYYANFYLNEFHKTTPEGTYNFKKKSYQNGQMFIKYMEKNSQIFEKQNDRQYEIMKYAAWFLDQNGYDICFQCLQWNFLQFFYQAINIEQNRKLNQKQLQHMSRYPII
ncbi:unnamed protein product [Paramecium sonneborni]|uniref:Tetratricopeptide repeat protein n=1 Tax=Paramecium sonneborni TaxID=65129 RepID=A0A8S1RGE7_9CILI|nr:unnamed protein product [Paramecium sonneborni]